MYMYIDFLPYRRKRSSDGTPESGMYMKLLLPLLPTHCAYVHVPVHTPYCVMRGSGCH